MTQYVGLDVSSFTCLTKLCDRCGSASVRSRRGPYSGRLWTALTTEGLPMVCLDARQAKKVLDMKVDKTDANDGEGLAHLVRAGRYREVRVKSRNAMLAKALLRARSQLLSMSLALENQVRGILKTFGRIVPKGAGGLFEKNVRALITDDAEIAAVIMLLRQARGKARSKCAALDRRLIASVQADASGNQRAAKISLTGDARLDNESKLSNLITAVNFAAAGPLCRR